MAEYKDGRNPIGIQITTSKLNGENYLLWAQSIRAYLTARRKLKFVTFEKPFFSNAKSIETAEEWDIDDSMVMTWLWNNMKPYFLLTLCFMQLVRQSGMLLVLHILWRITPLVF